MPAAGAGARRWARAGVPTSSELAPQAAVSRRAVRILGVPLDTLFDLAACTSPSVEEPDIYLCLIYHTRARSKN